VRILVRLLGFVVFLPAALFFLFGAWISQDPDFYADSLENSKVIHADMKLLGEAANAFKLETGRFPNADELQARIDPAALKWIGPRRGESSRKDWKLSNSISVATPGETCALGLESELSSDAMRYHRLCYWRGEWFEEYVPETGEHSIPTSYDDYLASMWQTVVVAMLGVGLLVCAYALVFHRRPQEAL